MTIRIFYVFILLLGATIFQSQAHASMHGGKTMNQSGAGSMPMPGMMSDGLMMPSMDPARGRILFATKGCVVCHAVNGIGGKDAVTLDATTMRPRMSPFEFAARMWRGAEAMILLQREELGEQIEFTGDELADIIAFTHSPEEQKKFSPADIPARMKKLMDHSETEKPH